MQAVRRRLPLLTWIALLALAVLSLLPTVSHVWAHAQGGSAYAEICTQQGARRVAVDGDAQPTTDRSASTLAQHLQHCPLCALALDAPPLPVAAGMLPLPLAAAAVPALFLHAPHTLHAWRSAQPRGPPTVS